MEAGIGEEETHGGEGEGGGVEAGGRGFEDKLSENEQDRRGMSVRWEGRDGYALITYRLRVKA